MIKPGWAQSGGSCIKREFMVNWGGSEVKKLLLRAEGKVNLRFSRAAKKSRRDTNVDTVVVTHLKT